MLSRCDYLTPSAVVNTIYGNFERQTHNLTIYIRVGYHWVDYL